MAQFIGFNNIHSIIHTRKFRVSSSISINLSSLMVIIFSLTSIRNAFAQTPDLQTLTAFPVQAIGIFIISLIISAIIIYVVSKLFGQKEGIERAFVAAIIGTIVYTIGYFLFGNGLIAALVGGVVWLLAIRWLYEITLMRALGIVIVVWIAAAIVGYVFPTLTGPL